MTDFAARLEPFILLARSTKGAAAAKVINDATAAPGVYVFSELLDLPNIRELQGDQNHSKAFALLELFAYGTLNDYNHSRETYPSLSPAHVSKLKHLTLVSSALKHRSLAYDDLLSQLDIRSVRELEDLIIDVIYSGLLKGKIHHHERTLHVDWVAGRDVRSTDLEEIRAGLKNCEAFLIESCPRALFYSLVIGRAGQNRPINSSTSDTSNTPQNPAEDRCSTAATLLDALNEQIETIQAQARSEKDLQTAYNRERDLRLQQISNTNSMGQSNRRNLKLDQPQISHVEVEDEILDQLSQIQKDNKAPFLAAQSNLDTEGGEKSGAKAGVPTEDPESLRGVKRSRE